jgi:carbonic anhydrase
MQRIIEGIRAFHSGRKDQEKFISDELVAAQEPDVLFITCSDSRVVPSIVTRGAPGRLFVVRNAGNLLPLAGAGSGEEGTVEYGIEALGIQHVVVCGHTHCGAMAGLFDDKVAEKLPAVGRWLELSRKVKEGVEGKGGGPREAVYANVLFQLERLRTYPSVAKALARGGLELHGWVYDIETARFSRFDEQRQAFEDLLEPS